HRHRRCGALATAHHQDHEAAHRLHARRSVPRTVPRVTERPTAPAVAWPPQPGGPKHQVPESTPVNSAPGFSSDPTVNGLKLDREYRETWLAEPTSLRRDD